MTETDTVDPAVNPDGLVMETLLTPEGRADPYPRYRQLREVAPVHRSDLGAVWFLTRWADCNVVLRDPRLGKGDLNDDRRALFNPGLPPRQQTVMGNSMLFVNPPDHTPPPRPGVAGVHAATHAGPRSPCGPHGRRDRRPNGRRGRCRRHGRVGVPAPGAGHR